MGSARPSAVDKLRVKRPSTCRSAAQQIWCQDTASGGPRLVYDEGRAIEEVMDHLRVDADQAYNTSRAVGNDAQELREELAGL